jgi:thiosulfate/3-mercaptopyruvate sulfurtransferase
MKFLADVDELNQRIKDGNAPVIIDTREEHAYAQAHIPGAVNVHDIFTYLCTRYLGGYEAMVAHFAKLLSRKGIRQTDEVVIYEDAMDNGYGQSCRGWFLLNYFGHTNVTVLHGGYRAWLDKGYSIDKLLPELPSTHYEVTPNAALIVTEEEMLAALGKKDIHIVDVRDYAEWIGANSSPYGYDFCPRKGRIPGATWLEWYKLMYRRSGIPYFRTKEGILKVCEKAGITPDQNIYLYCFKGARTSNTFLALKMVGFERVRNYFSSWNEWSRDFALPIDESYPDDSSDEP